MTGPPLEEADQHRRNDRGCSSWRRGPPARDVWPRRDYLYLTRTSVEQPDIALFRVPALGGPERLIHKNVDAPIRSPRMASVRIHAWRAPWRVSDRD